VIGAPGGPRNPCATCGACCRDYIVPVFGQDVWRIATGQRLGPEQFVVAYPQLREVHLDAFRLQKDGYWFGLMLDKRGTLKAGSPCVFLVDLAGGHSRCGIYGQRPSACQVYPMVAWSGIVAERQDSLCPTGAWGVADIVRPGWRGALQGLRMQLDVYGEVVARWNARVDASPADKEYVLAELLAYVMNVYDRLAALDAAAGPENLARIVSTWPNFPRAPLDLDVLDEPERAPLWLRYFYQARQVIDGFYPELPRLAPRLQTSPAERTESAAIPTVVPPPPPAAPPPGRLHSAGQRA
jgi:Fe-S-cluster containining protein